MSEWQPIETAPKTGETLLLGFFNQHDKWLTLRGQWYSYQQIEDDFEYTEEGWYETSVEADDPPNCWPTSPTHWMPLPKPPIG